MANKYDYIKLENDVSCFRDANQLNKLVDGYIRQIQRIVHNQIVPSDINKLCTSYILQTHSSYFTIYDRTRAQLQTIYNSHGDSAAVLSVTNEPLSKNGVPKSAKQKCCICRLDSPQSNDNRISCKRCSKSAHLICAKSNHNWYCKQCTILTGNKFQSIQVLKGTGIGGTDIVFLSEIAINSGVHELMFQCIKKHPNDKIGIISEGDLDILKEKGIGSKYLYNPMFGKYRYFWWCHTKAARVFDGRATGQRITLQGIGSWEAGDYIGMIVDCDKWTIQFKLDDGKSQLFDIQPETKYYAVLTMGDGSPLYFYDLA